MSLVPPPKVQSHLASIRPRGVPPRPASRYIVVVSLQLPVKYTPTSGCFDWLDCDPHAVYTDRPRANLHKGLYLLGGGGTISLGLSVEIQVYN